jgi:hypothetical protein
MVTAMTPEQRKRAKFKAKEMADDCSKICGDSGNGLALATYCCKEIIEAVSDFAIRTDTFWDLVLEELEKF